MRSGKYEEVQITKSTVHTVNKARKVVLELFGTIPIPPRAPLFVKSRFILPCIHTGAAKLPKTVRAHKFKILKIFFFNIYWWRIVVKTTHSYSWFALSRNKKIIRKPFSV